MKGVFSLFQCIIIAAVLNTTAYTQELEPHAEVALNAHTTLGKKGILVPVPFRKFQYVEEKESL